MLLRSFGLVLNSRKNLFDNAYLIYSKMIRIADKIIICRNQFFVLKF